MYIYVEHHSVCPLVGIGNLGLPQPLSGKQVCPPPPPPGPKVGGARSPAAKGVGKSQFRWLGKSLALWARTFKFLWGPGNDAKEWIPPAYV